MLTIDPTAFATSDNQGTIVDTGTTLTYLVAEAFDLFVNYVSFDMCVLMQNGNILLILNVNRKL